MSIEPGVIVHSGAGFFSDDRNAVKLEITKAAALAGWAALMANKSPQGDESPMDAVEAAIKLMEDHPECNAGYGSVLNVDGDVEMDAMIIRGRDLATGGVGAIRQVAHPISVARRVLDSSPHVLLVGGGAGEFAIAQGFPLVSPESLVSPRAKAMLASVLAKTSAPSTETGGVLEEEKGLGTVGAVAIDRYGHIVAGTSTGGLCGKMKGRVGDTPIPGAGTYCDDLVGGVSGTGMGEAIMRVCLSSRIANLMMDKGQGGQGMSPNEAILKALEEMSDRVGWDGGGIGIRKDGVMGHAHNSKKMTWASVQGGVLRYGVVAGEEFSLPLSQALSKDAATTNLLDLTVTNYLNN